MGLTLPEELSGISLRLDPPSTESSQPTSSVDGQKAEGTCQPRHVRPTQKANHCPAEGGSPAPTTPTSQT